MRYRPFITTFAAAMLLAAWAPAARAADISQAVQAAVSDPGRVPADIVRDPERKPDQVLAFAGVEPGQAVVDLAPDDGYYTRILSPLVGTRGKVYAFVPFGGAINAETLRREAKGAPLDVDAALAIENVSEYRNVLTIWEFLGLEGGQFAIPEQTDTVFVHNYVDLHTENVSAETPDLAKATKALFDALKPGGSYVVAGAAAAPGIGFSAADSLGRVEPAAVKKEILAAGFTLDGEDTLLANAADDRTKPVSAMNDKQDRFLMRFKKPANAPPDKRAQGMDTMKAYYGNTFITGIGLDRQRNLFFHPDGSYEELGKIGSLLQEGYWYIDAEGRNCILHQYPLPERGYAFCMMLQNHKVGEKWNVVSRRGPEVHTIVAGTVYIPK